MIQINLTLNNREKERDAGRNGNDKYESIILELIEQRNRDYKQFAPVSINKPSGTPAQKEGKLKLVNQKSQSGHCSRLYRNKKDCVSRTLYDLDEINP